MKLFLPVSLVVSGFVAMHNTNSVSAGSSSSSSPDACDFECGNAGHYHIYMATDSDGNDIASFPEAVLATPDGCILAPITSFTDVIEASNAVGSAGTRAFVGLYKSVADALDGDVDPREGWYNLDGSFLPDDANLWAANEPNEGGGGDFPELHAAIGFRTGLSDFPSSFTNSVNGAVYKCCYPNDAVCDDLEEMTMDG